jgi:hypothetical protein
MHGSCHSLLPIQRCCQRGCIAAATCATRPCIVSWRPQGARSSYCFSPPRHHHPWGQLAECHPKPCHHGRSWGRMVHEVGEHPPPARRRRHQGARRACARRMPPPPAAAVSSSHWWDRVRIAARVDGALAGSCVTMVYACTSGEEVQITVLLSRHRESVIRAAPVDR